jgi:hypothetical protein
MLVVGTLAALMLVGACSREDRQEFVAAVGSQVIAEGANDAFADAGIEVDGQMDCTSAAADGGLTHITCSGTSVDGQRLEITGDLVIENEDIVESRTFRGTADGEEVFSVQCIGEACDLGA